MFPSLCCKVSWRAAAACKKGRFHMQCNSPNKICVTCSAVLNITEPARFLMLSLLSPYLILARYLPPSMSWTPSNPVSLDRLRDGPVLFPKNCEWVCSTHRRLVAASYRGLTFMNFCARKLVCITWSSGEPGPWYSSVLPLARSTASKPEHALHSELFLNIRVNYHQLWSHTSSLQTSVEVQPVPQPV